MKFKLIIKLTKKLRAKQALKYIKKGGSHLDIGCGDKFLLKRSPCDYKIGLDKIYGDYIKKTIPLNKKFDYITMLAVLEHLDYPKDIIKESYRLLKKGGYLIITTPKYRSYKITRIYGRSYGEKINPKHKQYFTKQGLFELLKPFFKIIEYKTFEFGLNQFIVAKKQI